MRRDGVLVTNIHSRYGESLKDSVSGSHALELQYRRTACLTVERDDFKFNTIKSEQCDLVDVTCFLLLKLDERPRIPISETLPVAKASVDTRL